jgi:hypothetical protein
MSGRLAVDRIGATTATGRSGPIAPFGAASAQRSGKVAMTRPAIRLAAIWPSLF